MSESPFVPISEIVDALEESGEHASRRTVMNDIAAGRMPGEFRVTGKEFKRRIPRVKRHEWNAYLRGEWRPNDRKPVGIVSIQQKAS